MRFEISCNFGTLYAHHFGEKRKERALGHGFEAFLFPRRDTVKLEDTRARHEGENNGREDGELGRHLGFRNVSIRQIWLEIS